PHVVATIDLPDPYSHTHKVRVVGDLMYTNVEQFDRHFLRKSENLGAHRQDLTKGLGRVPTTLEIAAKLGVDAARISELEAFLERGYQAGGFRIYDISNRAAPKLLSHTSTFGFGVHRFDVDETHAYISTEAEGYIGNILLIYDIANTRAPVEVGRWSMPGQHLAAGEVPTWKGYKNRLHHAMRVGDELWASVWHAGLRVLDVSDITKPQTIAAFDYHPPFPEPTHTVLPLARLIDGRRIAVAVDEEHAHTPGRLHGFLWVLDVTDFSDTKALSAFDVSELDSPWARAPGRFGAHQFREKIDGTLIYVTWFAGGLRVVDVADPLHPEEVAHFIPEPIGDEPAPQSNDVYVDAGGLIYLIDRNRGLDILEMSL
ncbi:MAG: LVIVD repeat-containing protein, partial [Hyphomicrobiales bacterium]